MGLQSDYAVPLLELKRKGSWIRCAKKEAAFSIKPFKAVTAYRYVLLNNGNRFH